MYSTNPNLLGNGLNITDDGILLDQAEVCRRLNAYERTLATVLAGLIKIRYGTLKGKAQWLCDAAPETFGALDEMVDFYDPLSEYSTVKDLSLDCWIAGELIEEIQNEQN